MREIVERMCVGVSKGDWGVSALDEQVRTVKGRVEGGKERERGGEGVRLRLDQQNSHNTIEESQFPGVERWGRLGYETIWWPTKSNDQDHKPPVDCLDPSTPTHKPSRQAGRQVGRQTVFWVDIQASRQAGR